jgi:ATP-dependent DNA helicase RecQ
MESAVFQAAEKLNYLPLKEEQEECISEFLKGNDVFAILPTCYGKTVCFACIPSAFDIYLNKSSEETSIIVVVSPLTALIKDQVNSLSKRGISCVYVDVDSEIKVKDDVNKGLFNIVFMSPELIVGKWRNIFNSQIYKKRLVGLVVDEAHCVIKW